MVSPEGTGPQVGWPRVAVEPGSSAGPADNWPDCSEERAARAALSAVLDPGYLPVLAVLASTPATEVWQRLRRGDAALDPAGRFHRLANGVDGSRILEEAAAADMDLIIPSDPQWATGLDDLAHAAAADHGGMPAGLWVRGVRAALAQRPRVAIVGSRAATSYGVEVAGDLAMGLAEAGFTVVSGAAYGVDAAAHRGALGVGGPTVAVLAGGVDVPYPRGNSALIARIVETGLLVSEMAPGRGVTRRAFLARNRLIAALSSGVVLVEAGLRSGARNTTTWGDALSRPVCAVPGPVTSSMSVGPHALIRQGQLLVTSTEEVLEAVSPSGSHLVADAPPELRLWDALDPDAKVVLDAFAGGGTTSVAELVRETGFDLGRVLAIVSRLVDVGAVTGGGDVWRLAAAHRSDREATGRPSP